MNCPNCKKEVLPDRSFCNWCNVFIPNPTAGTKAGLFQRFIAWFLDPAIILAGYLIFVLVIGGSILTLVAIFGCGSNNMKKAQEYIDAGMYQHAVQLLQIEIAERPKNIEAHYLMGIAFLSEGKKDQAEEAFNRAILMDTGYRAKIAQIYMGLGFKIFPR